MRRLGWSLVALVSLVFGTGPTVGDIGSCGRSTTLLDAAAFAAARKGRDCERCGACGLRSTRCTRACDPKASPDFVLPSTCFPLERDGEVCLRALEAASCDDYAAFMDDAAPAVPSECAFCALLGDGGR